MTVTIILASCVRNAGIIQIQFYLFMVWIVFIQPDFIYSMPPGLKIDVM